MSSSTTAAIAIAAAVVAVAALAAAVLAWLQLRRVRASQQVMLGGGTVTDLARNPALANQMGEAGRKQVEADYNITSLVPRLISIFCDFARKYGKKSILNILEHRHPLNSYATSRVSTHGLPLSAA